MLTQGSKPLMAVRLINRSVQSRSAFVNHPTFRPPNGAQSIAEAEAAGRGLLGGVGQSRGHYFPRPSS